MEYTKSACASQVAAVDFETFYDSKQSYSLRNMTPRQYVTDFRFDPYMVSVAVVGEETWVGDPRAYDWTKLAGRTLLAHNAAFDGMVLNRLMELHMVPQIEFEWEDTADMCVFLGYPRTLAGSAAALLNIEKSKKVRADMDGKNLSDAVREGWSRDLYEYAGDDAELCLELWLRFSDQFPMIEREVSRQNRKMGWRGVQIDVGLCRDGARHLMKHLEKAKEVLPWVAQGKPAASTAKFSEQCRLMGIEPPTTYKKDSPEFLNWRKENPEMEDLSKARMEVAGLNMHISRLNKMAEQADENGILYPSLKFFGSHTGRYASGEQGASGVSESGPVNLLNLPRKPIYGIDIRGTLIPRKGHKFVVFDYGQIEPRVNLWLAGDTEMLDLVRKAEDKNIYFAAGVRFGWVPEGMTLAQLKKNDPLYKLLKAIVIGLGYAMGSVKFMATIQKGGTPIDPMPRDQWPLEDPSLKFLVVTQLGMKMADIMDPANEQMFGTLFACHAIVKLWRGKNQKILAFHKSLEMHLRSGADASMARYDFELPSGRNRPYFRPKVVPVVEMDVDPETELPRSRAVRKLIAATTYAGKALPTYGGRLCENIVQSLSRDIMAYAGVDIETIHPSWHFLWSVHDELIFETPFAEVERALEEIPRIMCEGPSIVSWTQGLPLTAEGSAHDRYGK